MNNRLHNILNGNEENVNSILFYGMQAEKIIGSDLIVRGFAQFLVETLHQYGFDNIVFYDSTNAHGKYVYDDESAYYSFGDENKAAYIEKYGHTPNCKDNKTDVNPTNVAPGGISFGLKRVEVDQAQNQTDCVSHELRRMERNMSEIAFFGELVALMKETSFRSAIVINNIYDQLRFGKESYTRRLSEMILNDFENSADNKNLLILLAPDVSESSTEDNTCGSSAEGLRQVFAVSSLREKFMIHGKDVWCFDPNRTFRIGTPGIDETKYLIEKYTLAPYKGKRIVTAESVDTLADKLLYLMRDGYERASENNSFVRPATLAELDRHLRYFISHADGETVMLDEAALHRISPFDSKLEQDPTEKLKNTNGWEGAYTALNDAFSIFFSNYPQYLECKVNTCDAVTYTQSGGISLITSRFNNDSSHSFPSAPELPHVLLTGPVGVGKTTIAHLIGKIAHDRGLLETGHLVVAHPNDLISDHVGGTYAATERMITKASGGVLLIDEAYELFESKKNRGSSFKNECITTLVQALTDSSKHFLLILAGYSCSAPDADDGVEALFKMNDGLESRIGCRIKLDNYSAPLLAQITIDRMKERGIELGQTINKEGLIKLWESKLRKRNRKTFGNARDAVRYTKTVIDSVVKRSIAGMTLKAEAEDFPVEDRELLLGKELSYDDVIKEISEKYPGLGEVAAEIISNCVRRYKSRIEREKSGKRKKKDGRIQRHLLFVGKPGTGKTTLAINLAIAMGIVGLTSGAEPVIISNPRDCTPAQIKEKAEDAVTFNTFLLVDEAYELSGEAITALLNPMTQNDDLMCIFCAYEDKLDELEKKNEGFLSRCDIIRIPDYTPDQLLEIFKKMADDEGYSVTNECFDDLKILFKNRYDTRELNKSYANARDVEVMLGTMSLNCDIRTNEGSISYELCSEDIPSEYREIIDTQKQNADIDKVLNELHTYVGFEKLEEYLKSLDNQIKICKKKNIEFVPQPGHFAFLGPAGRGKTTGAQMFARALYAMGIIKTPKLTSYSASDLIAGYVGQTAIKTRQALNEGRYGVILIDEAYILTIDEGGGSNNSFRQEAVTEMLLFLEEEQKSGDTIVILAGYTEPLEKMIKSHKGFSSRVENMIYFDEYTNEQCLSIFKGFLAKAKPSCVLADDAEAYAISQIEQMKSQDDFGNGRDMRVLAKKIVAVHNNRIVKLLQNESGDELTDEIISTITSEDFE